MPNFLLMAGYVSLLRTNKKPLPGISNIVLGTQQNHRTILYTVDTYPNIIIHQDLLFIDKYSTDCPSRIYETHSP